MRRRFMRWLPAVAVVLAALAALGTTVPAGAATRGVPATARSSGSLPAGVKDPCAAPAQGHATCAALTVPPGTGTKAPAAAATPAGFSPANLLSAYGLPTSGYAGNRETVAVVTAYDDPDAASDLATYRSQYGLAACTAASGCFDKVNQTGGTTYPGTSAGWSAADAQSLDAISAICPACKLLLVEANGSSISDLGAAENEAVTLGAGFVDNDWFTPETTLGSSETTYDSEYFNHPGVAITAPAGNSGYGVEYPAASQYVTAVGGTTLTQNTGVSRGWTETAWSSTGAGCSAYEPKPAWQTDTGCSDRTLNDTAAVADPGTPVAYYDTPTEGGWSKGGGGTVISAAIVAGIYALAGTPAPGTYPSSYLYQHPRSLNAITSGSDGTCSPAYLCTAGTGYNGPAGQGTPSGAVAFATNGARPAVVLGTSGTTYVFVRGTSGDVQVDSRASGSSIWSGLTSLGGTFATYPAAEAQRSGYIWVAGVSGGNLEAADLPTGSGTWSSWANLGNPGTSLMGTPAIVQDTSGTTHVFVRSTAGTLYTATQASGATTWSSFASLGGTWPNDVSADVGSGGWVNVYAVGTAGYLDFDDLPPGGTWSDWTSISGGTIGVPAVMIDQAGSAKGTWRVFARTKNAGLDEADAPSGVSTYSMTSRGGTWQLDPAAFPGSGGADWLYETGNTAATYYDELGNGTWTSWTSLGGSFAGVPGATQNSSGNELFAVSRSGQLEFASLANGAASWSSFSNLGGPVGQS